MGGLFTNCMSISLMGGSVLKRPLKQKGVEPGLCGSRCGFNAHGSRLRTGFKACSPRSRESEKP